MVKISAVSDLHLEFADCELAGGEFIVLAGDIWTAAPMNKFMNDGNSRSMRKRYERFCVEELSKYRGGVIIAGNHEYYGGQMEEVPATISNFLAIHAPHITFLDNDSITVDGITFLGTTLWSPCGDTNPLVEMAVHTGLNDFKRIWIGNKLFTPADAAFLFRRNLVWLDRNLDRYKVRNCVVVTHHSPTYLGLSDEHATSELAEAYCSNLHEVIEESPHIKAWFFGHTHAVKDMKIGETVVRSNPRGYHGYENIAKRFDSKMADIEVEVRGRR